jgi:hypothetical protein
MFGEDAFKKLGIYKVDSKNVILNSNLFKDIDEK